MVIGMSRRVRKRRIDDLLTSTPQRGAPREQQIARPGTADEGAAENRESPFGLSSLQALDAIEQRASDQLQGVVSMIDRLLKI